MAIEKKNSSCDNLSNQVQGDTAGSVESSATLVLTEKIPFADASNLPDVELLGHDPMLADGSGSCGSTGGTGACGCN